MTEDANQLSKGAGQVSSALVRGLLAYSRQCGVIVPGLIERFGANSDFLDDPDGRLDIASYDALFHECTRLSGDGLFGLRLGSETRIRHLGAIGYLLMSADTLAMALTLYRDYQMTLGEGISFDIQFHESTVELTFAVVAGDRSVKHRAESFLSAILAICGELTGGKVLPQSAELSHSLLASSDVYQMILGVVPQVSERNRLVFLRSDLNERLQGADFEMRSYVENRLLAHRERIRERSAASEVYRWLQRGLMRRQDVSIEAVSSRMGISVRTLQAKLKSEDLSFRELHDKLLKDLALKLLEENRPIAEISFALGFAEPSSFQRAFRRWTGLTPSQARLSAKNS